MNAHAQHSMLMMAAATFAAVTLIVAPVSAKEKTGKHTKHVHHDISGSGRFFTGVCLPYQLLLPSQASRTPGLEWHGKQSAAPSRISRGRLPG